MGKSYRRFRTLRASRIRTTIDMALCEVNALRGLKSKRVWGPSVRGSLEILTGRDRGGVERRDGVTYTNQASAENLGAKPSAMDEAAEDPSTREALQVRTRFAEPDSPKADAAHLKLAAYEVVQRDTSRHDVPSRRARFDCDLAVPGQRLDSFDLD